MDSLGNPKKIQGNHRGIGLEITYYLKLAELRVNMINIITIQSLQHLLL